VPICRRSERCGVEGIECGVHLGLQRAVRRDDLGPGALAG